MRIPRGLQSGARVSSIIVGTMLMLLAPGCGGDDVAGPGGGTPPIKLFEDTFDGPTVSGAWMQTILDCFADIDGAVGNPAPSLNLRMDPAATASGTGIMTTFQPFNSADGLTFTMLIFVDNPGRAGLNIDGVSVTLIDQGRQNSARGGVGFHRNGLGGVTVSYAIYPGGPSSQISENIALSAGFSEFEFIIAPDGSTRWVRDGIQKLATTPGVQMITADIQIQLRLNGVGASVDPDQTTVHFDNVTVTRP